jgi:hypothetical protein
MIIIFTVIICCFCLFYFVNKPKQTIHFKFNNEVELGLQRMNTKNVIFAGIVQNEGNILQSIINDIHSVGKFFNSYNIVIYENNSTDNTKHILNENKSIHLMSEDIPFVHKASFYNNSDILLTNYRNKYRSYITNHFDDYDYVIVLNFNKKHLSLQGIAHSFSVDTWDIVFNNSDFDGIGIYSKEAFENDQDCIKYVNPFLKKYL